MGIVNFLENLSLGKEFITFIVSMIPVVELRGAIPIGVSLGLSHWTAMAISIVGNLVPVPFIILFIRKVFAWMRRKIPKLGGFVDRMEKKAESKRDFILKWETLGLLILVAIPLPGTGAWTGALVAALMDIRMKKAFPAIAGGVIVAGLIVVLITYGVTEVII